MTTIADFDATTIDGSPVDLGSYLGDVVLVVNTASKCGFTPQYEGLEQLHQQFSERGLAVIGFPCDQFGHQEPGDEQEIATFCSTAYNVTFPMMAKVEVNGANAHPLYAWLRASKSGLLGGRIKWNFTKFLIGRDGQVIARYAPTTKPEELVADIEAALKG
ncbi:glutathione peroxidase [Calidifontibacter terrae]